MILGMLEILFATKGLSKLTQDMDLAKKKAEEVHQEANKKVGKLPPILPGAAAPGAAALSYPAPKFAPFKLPALPKFKIPNLKFPDLSAFKSKLIALSRDVNRLAHDFSSFGNRAALAAGGLFGAMVRLAGVADPIGFQRFKASIQILGIEVGRIFIPILHRLTETISSVSSWFERLSPAQRQLVRNFAVLAVSILAVNAVGGKLAGFFLGGFAKIASGIASVIGLAISLGPAILSAITTVGGALAAAGGWVVALVVAAAAVQAAMLAAIGAVFALGAAFLVFGQDGDSIMEKLGNLWKTVSGAVSSAVQAIWAVLKPFWAIFAEGFQKVANRVVVFAGIMWDLAKDIVTIVADIVKDVLFFGASWEDVFTLAQGAFSIFVDFVVSAAEVIAKTLIAITVAFKATVETVKDIVGRLVDILTAIANFDFKHPVESAKNVAEEIKKAFSGNPFEQLSPSKLNEEIQKKFGEFDVKVKAKDQASAAVKTVKDEPARAAVKKPELYAIGEAMRRAQTAQTDDPSLEVQRKQLAVQEDTNKKIEALTATVAAGGLA